MDAKVRIICQVTKCIFHALRIVFFHPMEKEDEKNGSGKHYLFDGHNDSEMFTNERASPQPPKTRQTPFGNEFQEKNQPAYHPRPTRRGRPAGWSW